MNVSLLTKKLRLLLLMPLFWFGVVESNAQTPSLDVIRDTILVNDTLHYQFDHYNIIIPPYITTLPSHGSGYFNPYSSGDPRKGIKGWKQKNHVYYVPSQGFTGRDTLEVFYYYHLGGGQTYSGYKILYITVVPSHLTANNDYAATNQGQPVDIPVLVNDVGNGSNLTIATIPNVNHGTAIPIDGNTKIRFTPHAGFSGIANLNYTICDAQGSCDMAIVSICVLKSVAPAYDSLFITTEKNTPQVVLMPLDDNYHVDLAPAHGLLDTLETLVYVPNANYTGYDKVIFKDTINNRTRVFSIRVLDVPAPNNYLYDDIVFTPVGTTIDQIHLLKNDAGGKYLMNVGVIGYPNTQHGGQLTYLPGIGKGVYKYTPPPGFTGIDKFTYRATPPNNANFEYAQCYIVVNDQDPGEAVFHIVTPKNTPMVLGDHLPFDSYEYTNLNGGDIGSLSFYPGQQTVTSSHGQTFSGYNMLVYDPNPNVTGEDEIEFNYCAGNPGGSCPLVKIEIDVVELPNPQSDTLCAGKECVWSGDANQDGRVDVRDILPIGLCMGEVGQSRLNGSVAWYGQYANNWNNIFSDNLGFNAKYVDTDGNGKVTSLDTLAIRQFYGKYHNLTPEPTQAIYGLPFYIEAPDFNNIQPGDVLYAPIHLGNDTFPAIDAYGLAFGIDYDPALFESVKVIFSDTSWMGYNSPILSMEHKPFDGKLDAGYTRTSGISASGYGKIGVVEFIVTDDVIGTRLIKNTTTINLHSFGLMTGTGQTFGLEGNSLTFNLNLPGDNQDDDRPPVTPEQLVLFPNPAKNFVNIHLNGYGNEIERVVLYSVVGEKVYDSGSIQMKRNQIDVTQLTQGMYMIKVWTSSGEILNSKFEVVR